MPLLWIAIFLFILLLKNNINMTSWKKTFDIIFFSFFLLQRKDKKIRSFVIKRILHFCNSWFFLFVYNRQLCYLHLQDGRTKMVLHSRRGSGWIPLIQSISRGKNHICTGKFFYSYFSWAKRISTLDYCTWFFFVDCDTHDTILHP